ncbi:PREDICTED: uncharacterized protein LOC105458409 [Wasmannia auropunctata]|uniref:uncharacterized protein LOC105458409 n=1 Tax=Wasmannia auropunctata TaxID=64793 RepID=UPI0005EE0F7D|nr:PREDICTED: uncharacterized protein LOC105458409 [Wasmannia auropunctata]
MEDEDFGFAKRTDNVLKKVFTVSNAQTHKDTVHNVEQLIYSPPKTSEVVGGGGSTTPAPLIGAGSEGPERASTAAGSVVPNTPNIPNVVEYHLKVKPRSTTRHCRLDNVPRDQPQEEMKKEKSPVSSDDKKKDLVSKLSRLSIDNNVFEGSTDLPQVFQVKYLGSHDARGLWGIKHTRRPVDNMVSAAKALPTNTMLPLIKLVVSQEGVALLPLDKRKQDAKNLSRMYPIETISYGVQDLVYTRVFSMIVVRETENFRRISPFECHGFVCESKYYARQLTYALAAAFEIYSKNVKAQEKLTGVTVNNTARKRFAIDLRSPEEIEADLTMDSEA